MTFALPRAPHLVTGLAVLAIVGRGRPVAAVSRPFGSHPLTYAAGSIRPNHVSQTTLDRAVRDFYDAWKARYVKQMCAPGHYLVEANTAPDNLTVSEAHGYGMIIMTLMAGRDPDARAVFDGMHRYFRTHSSAFHDYLMAYFQNLSCADANGDDSASDGDLDIAFALLLADRQWGASGPIDYRGEALRVLADIRDGDVDSTGRYVLLGDWALPDDPYYNATRSSDFMPDHYRSFAAAMTTDPWRGLLDRTYEIVAELQTNFSSETGLLPDFIINPLDAPRPADANFLEGPNDGAYDYNACRDPWRLGTDFIIAGEPRAKIAVDRITQWIRNVTANKPENIGSGHQLDGTLSPGADYLSMEFVAPLGVGAMADAANQAWLNDIWDLVVATPIDDQGYYGNTLKLLSMLVMSGNWWAPHLVGGGATAGDCDGNGQTDIAELVLGVQILVAGGSTERCSALDASADGVIQVDELLRAIGAALQAALA